MCQAIVKPAAITIEKDVLLRSWKSNSDGAGFAYIDGDHVHIEKGFMRFKAFYKAYRRHAHKDLLIHFRWATHGGKTEENCHPFKIAKDAALIHNGVLYNFTPSQNSTLSDTRTFLETVLKPALATSGMSSHGFLSSPITLALIESLIGTYNKFACLTPQGFTIFNEDQGEWYEGAWYSAGFPEVDTLESAWRRYNTLASDPYEEEEEEGYTTDDREEKLILAALEGKACRDTGCEFCGKASRVLYDIGGGDVCPSCWMEYTGTF